MHPLARRIALLVAGSSLLTGVFLLGYNLRLITEDARTLALQAWPVLLIAGGVLLVADSTRKRAYSRAQRATTVPLPIVLAPAATELACRAQFSYGRLAAGAADSAPRLLVEQYGVAAVPTMGGQLVGHRQEVFLSMARPIFPSYFQLQNSWRLELPRSLPLQLTLQLHDADLSADLRGVDLLSVDLRAEAGTQEIRFPRPRATITARLHASGSLAIVVPAAVFAWVRLLNPFCRVDYPQGDFERREDGSLASAGQRDPRETIDIEVDGPLRTLLLDVDDDPQS